MSSTAAALTLVDKRLTIVVHFLTIDNDSIVYFLKISDKGKDCFIINGYTLLIYVKFFGVLYVMSELQSR